ncbi:hypothetical protein PGTUg99_020940 [Puccinia graminis f. sp. tritici]|uniref:Uncharacterized protein n=1 Tax=Puccinia graminis f. sp. tritici TaxID=56615 RepID=A0A5B0R4D9_PUCGR|nr:hypothetical protein PGTUg99_020940 [Puccinia graminis f. sp. tritici]
MRISMVNTSHSNAWAESADHYHRTAQQGASPSLWWSGLCFGPWQWNCMQFLPCRVLPSAERPGQLPRRPLIKPAEQMGGEPPIPQLAEVVSFLGGFDTSLQPYADSSLPTSEKQKQEQASGGAPSLQELKESS